MKTKHRLAFLVLSILIIGLISAHADTIQPMYTAIVNNLPGGGLEMINLSDGKLYFQAGDSVYGYEPDQSDPFHAEYANPDKGLKFAFILGDDLYYNLWEQATLTPVNSLLGQDEISLFPALVQNKALSSVQPFIQSTYEGKALTFMAAAVSRQNGDLFFLCRLDIDTGDFKYIQVDELKSFTNTKNGNTVYFNKAADSHGTLSILVNELEWNTMKSNLIGTLPFSASGTVYLESSESVVYIDDKKVMMKSADQPAELLIDIGDILNDPLACPDQRGFILQGTYYIAPIIVGENQQIIQMNLNDLGR